MAVTLEQGYPQMAMDPQMVITTNGTSYHPNVKTVKISNISLAASEQDIREFFSFSGDIQYLEMQSKSDVTKLAYVTFKDAKGAETAGLLSGATIADRAVIVTAAENYQLPLEAYMQISGAKATPAESAVRKAEDMVSSMLAKGYVLSKDALESAKAFDERHQFLSTASAAVASIDRRIGLTEKLGTGAALVSGKVAEVDERFQVSGIAGSALATAKERATVASSAIMGNRYVAAGASWFSSALNAVTKAAVDVGALTREKAERAEVERKEVMWREKRGMVNEYAQLHLDEPPSPGAPAIVAVQSADDQKLSVV
ncbi:binding partner of ACD11 1-like isoform X2 [Ananas comosus]|uniref:Binding partner of ACD11 1-like isoform X2 n=1 Tax=Ananas comosus TaxID=4615 RepID=A0A6P5GCW1_ANACO|nr:binding partner of ACD11 1-like isoform X2 [Ananas comosus]